MNQIVAALVGCGVIATAMMWVGSEGNPVFLVFFIGLVIIGFVTAFYTEPTELIPAQQRLED